MSELLCFVFLLQIPPLPHSQLSQNGSSPSMVAVVMERPEAGAGMLSLLLLSELIYGP